MTSFFASVYTYFLSRRKRLVLLLATIIVGLFASLFHLNYKEDISEFLPENKTDESINSVYRHIGNSNKIIVYFSPVDTTIRDEERITEAIQSFASELETSDSLRLIPEILFQTDENRFWELSDFITRNAPYFLTEADYDRIDSMSVSDSFFVSQMEENKRLLQLPSGSLMKRSLMLDPLRLFSPPLMRLRDFQAGSDENRPIRNGFMFSPDGKKGMVIVTSPHNITETAHNEALLETIEKTAAAVKQVFPDIDIRSFGAPVIAVTNARQIKTDGMYAIGLAIVLILVTLGYFFRSGRNLFLLFFSVAFGWLFALGTIAIFKTDVSIIALGISSVFIGIALNYPLHTIDHLTHAENKLQALKTVIPPLVIGNITTVGAFLSLVFIDSGAMRDMGLFGSLLPVGTLLFVLFFLPHAVVSSAKPAPQITDLFAGVNAKKTPVPLKKIGGTLFILLTVVFLYFSRFTAFEPDIDRINYMTEQQRADMQEILQSVEKRDKDIVYLVSGGKRLDDALTTHERNNCLVDSLRMEGKVESVSGIGRFLASKAEQERRIERWNRFRRLHGDSLRVRTEAAAVQAGFRPNTFAAFYQCLDTCFTPRDEAFFAPLISQLADNYIVREETSAMVVSLLYCNKGRTAAVKARLSRLEDSFSFDSRNIGRRLVDALSDDFNHVLYICGFIVFAFLTISFVHAELSFAAFLPLAVGWIWILGIMHVCDIRFNIVNIILASFIFGQGDDYSIFITEGLMYEYAYRRKTLKSYKNSIVISAIVMLIGIGTLIFAKHPAMRSLAEVTTIGMITVVCMAYLIPPFIFRRLTRNKHGLRKVPWTFKRFFASIYAFGAFLIGCSMLTAYGFFLFGIRRKKESYEKRKFLYHSFLRRVSDFVVRRVPGVGFRYENPAGETFEKPAIIVSNHQSHLDLMCLMMLTPRLVILTNDWVWNNPFYGKLIKYADFYPVSDGIERSLDSLADLVKRGYSIVVFPEGTRSPDCRIQRFRRGAFYLAECLGLDVIPVLLHGAGHVLPKNDFLLREGNITVQVHPRIALDSPSYSSDYATRTKEIREYYRESFARLTRRLETAEYFRSFVLHNYYYKGIEIERGVRAEWKRGHIAKRVADFRGEGTVLIRNNGYGVFSFVFALVHKNVSVIAVDDDENKVAIARNCVGKPDNLVVYHTPELPETYSKGHIQEIQWTNM